MGKVHKINGLDANSDTTATLIKFRDVLKRASQELYSNGKLNRQLFSYTLDAFGVISKLDTPVLIDEIYSLLESKNDSIRSEAIATLGFDSRFHLPEFRDKAYEIFKTEQSDSVKTTAIIAWCSYYYETNNPNVLWSLYIILKNGLHDIGIRTAAFCGICNVTTAEYPGYDRYISSTALLECEAAEEFNSKIDWNEVERIINKYVPLEKRTEK